MCLRCTNPNLNRESTLRRAPPMHAVTSLATIPKAFRLDIISSQFFSDNIQLKEFI